MNIILVDDQQSNIKVLRYALVGMDNLDIYEAPNGEVAVELATKHEFDIILMDVNMPIMGGLEATKIIKGLNKHAIIVGISSDSELSTIHAMIKAGADDYLVKPIVAQIFRHRIKYYINAVYNDRLINYDGKPINAFNTQ